MKKYLLILSLAFVSNSLAAEVSNKGFESIKNYHFVSEQLASSGMLELETYDKIKGYGFKHVINLIPGMQLKERKRVESLDMSYEQIPVDWHNPTLADFEKFVELMKAYGEDKVYVHCQLNWRASTFVYLYRVTQLGVAKADAEKDLLAIWEPEDNWQKFINTTLKAYQS